jgi:hypothetical protein
VTPLGEQPLLSNKASQMAPQGSVEWNSRILRAWQLALLRFAITLDDADRMNVMGIAKEIDRGGRARDEPADFSFFRKTSSDLCTSILRQSASPGTTLLQYLARIDDDRLKRAFASAIGVDQAPPARKPKKVNNDRLWRGLAPRGDIRSRAC